MHRFQVPINGSIDAQHASVTVHVPEGDDVLTSYVRITPDQSLWNDPFSYLEVSVTAVATPSNSSRVTNSSFSTRNAGPHTSLRDTNQFLTVTEDPLQRESADAVALYAVRGMNGGEARSMRTDEPLPSSEEAGAASATGSVVASRRNGAGWQSLEWYLQDNGPPQIDLPVPHFLYQVSSHET